MPHKTNKDPYLKFHDVNNNASLITVFSSLPADIIEEFSQQLRDAWTHLTVHEPRDLYGENKSFFIKALLKISPEERIKYLIEILPLMKRISELEYESWEVAVIAEHLADLYGRESYPRALDRIKKQLAKTGKNQGNGYLSNEILINWGN